MTPEQIRKILLRCGAEERKNNVHHRIYLNIFFNGLDPITGPATMPPP